MALITLELFVDYLSFLINYQNIKSMKINEILLIIVNKSLFNILSFIYTFIHIHIHF